MKTRHGLSLVECLAVVLALSMVGMSMGPSLHVMRTRSMGITSAAKLRDIGMSGAMYAGANDGRLFGYSWRAGETYTMPDGKLRTPSSDTDAASRQNQEILQRRTGRLQGDFKIRNFLGRLPHRRYSHLVLMDFLDESFESTRYIDPADSNQFVWTANPFDYRVGSTVPYANPDVDPGYDQNGWNSEPFLQRWAFASSYQVVPTAWQPDSPHARWVPTASSPHLFEPAGEGEIQIADGRSMTEVLYPSHKVWMFEEFDREAEGSPYFAYDHARSAKLMFDGSVNLWASGDAYSALVPEHGYFAWEQTYVPLDAFPVPLGGLGDSTKLNQRYRWTFRGLRGIDYGPNDPDGR